MKYDSEFTMTIGGRAATAIRQISVLNPSTEAVIAKVPDAELPELDQAVVAARKAFPAWRDMPLAARQALVAKLGEDLLTQMHAFVQLLTTEQGKPLAQAEQEVGAAAYWLQAVSRQEPPEKINEDNEVRRSVTRHVPIGVVGAIAPWNFPLLLAMCKVAPALVAGNTVILKPSPFTPLTTLKFGELARSILPPGVLNVITGGDQLGPLMTEHAGIDKISFTGSTATGKRVMQSVSSSLKRLTLELGGNDVAIVLEDADIEAIAPRLFWSAFLNSGQLCVATKRLYVHEAVYEDLVSALKTIVQGIKIGDGFQPDVALGPIQNRLQYDRVKALIEDAKSSGLSFITGGEVPSDTPGFFVPIALIDNPPEDSRVVVEEAFGPVLPILKFSNIDDVVRRANNTIYGLAGSVWSRDLAKAEAIAARLETGTVWINECQYLLPDVVFGGHKQSGFGVEYGIEGLLEFMLTQTIVTLKAAA